MIHIIHRICTNIICVHIFTLKSDSDVEYGNFVRLQKQPQRCWFRLWKPNMNIFFLYKFGYKMIHLYQNMIYLRWWWYLKNLKKQDCDKKENDNRIVTFDDHSKLVLAGDWYTTCNAKAGKYNDLIIVMIWL